MDLQFNQPENRTFILISCNKKTLIQTLTVIESLDKGNSMETSLSSSMVDLMKRQTQLHSLRELQKIESTSSLILNSYCAWISILNEMKTLSNSNSKTIEKKTMIKISRRLTKSLHSQQNSNYRHHRVLIFRTNIRMGKVPVQ